MRKLLTIKNIFKIVIIFFVLIVLGNLTAFLKISPSEFTWKIFLSNSLNSVVIGGIMGGGIIIIQLYIEKKYPWLENPVKRLVYQLVFTIGYCLLVIVLVLVAISILNHRNIPADVLLSNFIFMVKVALSFLVASMLISAAVQFFINWKKSVVMQEELKREQLNLQYETLKNQVNPHFLFNSLNSITSLIKKEPDKAIEFTRKLSEVFRYVLDQKDNEIIRIEEEMTFLDSYIFLQKIRFGERLKVTINVDNTHRFIVPLSLQILVENAIKHNEISKEFPLKLDIFSEDGYIVVRNNLKKKQVANSSGIGLKNIRSQFAFFTSNPLIVEENDTFFLVKIPVIEEEKEEG